MAKFFLGSVGEAEAYEVNSDPMTGETKMDLVFKSKTITDSAVNISVQKSTIVDSYNGASAGIFYHSPSVKITVTDIIWNSNYLEATLGTNFNQLCEEDNCEYYEIKLNSNSEGIVNIPSTAELPAPLNFQINNGEKPYVVIGKLSCEDEWHSFYYDSTDKTIGKDARLGENKGILKPETTYCFKYSIRSNRSKTINITSRIIPKELFLVITTPVFVAIPNGILNPLSSQYDQEYNCVSSGKMVGQIVYEVPRWSLDGDIPFNFSSSSPANMQLTGEVLESIDNNEESVFMRLREFIRPRVWYEGLIEILGDETEQPLDGSVSPTIYGIYSDGSYNQIFYTEDTENYSIDDIKFVFEPEEGVEFTSAPNSLYHFDRHDYNVTGKFTSINGTVKVYPATIYLDENNNEILVKIDNVYCELTYNTTHNNE